jgi:hypothetical protein
VEWVLALLWGFIFGIWFRDWQNGGDNSEMRYIREHRDRLEQYTKEHQP